MRHLIDPLDFTRQETDRLLSLAEEIIARPGDYAHLCDGKILATLFYEPSTRTRLSFESAMMRLGGKVLGFSSAGSSSAAKGESVADTIRMISGYADIAAMRHFKEGAPLCGRPLLPHPRYQRRGRRPPAPHPDPSPTCSPSAASGGEISGVTIGLCGDLKFGRTVHSLIKSLVRYEGVNFIFISPEELRVPSYILKEWSSPPGTPWKEVRTMEEVMPELDILYMTRVQRERFFNEEDYVRQRTPTSSPSRSWTWARRTGGAASPAPCERNRPRGGQRPRAMYFEQPGAACSSAWR